MQLKIQALADCLTGLGLTIPAVRTTTEMQVEIGSVRTTAHRTQIRPFNEQNCSDRPYVMISTSKTSNMAETSYEPVSVGVDVACPGE